jgi:dTMP kinase
VDKGKFITIEGGDGAGKSTQIPFLENLIRSRGHKLQVTREPGGTELGERLREILLNYSGGMMSDDTELMLMFAARKQHLSEVIVPALESGIWVLCDRFTDATYAYQGGGRGIDASRIAVLENWVQQGLQPDLTLLLDVPVEVGLGRTGKRGEASDRFEQQKVHFKELVRENYLDRARRFSERIKRIDAGKDLDTVQARIVDEFNAFVDIASPAIEN